MKKQGHIEGIDRVVKGLNDKLREYKIGGTRGLMEAVKFIHYQIEHVPPMVPVDTGNLRNSWEVKRIQVSGKPVIQFGYSANYAVYVHEMVDADFVSPRMMPYRKRGKYEKSKGMYHPRKGAGAKYLESHIKNNVFKILLMIREQMTSKGALK